MVFRRGSPPPPPTPHTPTSTPTSAQAPLQKRRLDSLPYRSWSDADCDCGDKPTEQRGWRPAGACWKPGDDPLPPPQHVTPGQIANKRLRRKHERDLMNERVATVVLGHRCTFRSGPESPGASPPPQRSTSTAAAEEEQRATGHRSDHHEELSHLSPPYQTTPHSSNSSHRGITPPTTRQQQKAKGAGLLPASPS